MTTRRHVIAIAALVARDVLARPRPAARLAAYQLRCVAEEGDEQLAARLGVTTLVGRARDEHLASLGADEGLAALCVDWLDVVDEAVRTLERAFSRCSGCGARLPRHGHVCSRCRRRVPGPA